MSREETPGVEGSEMQRSPEAVNHQAVEGGVEVATGSGVAAGVAVDPAGSVSLDVVVELLRRLQSGSAGSATGSLPSGNGATAPERQYLVMPDLTKGLQQFTGRGGASEAGNWLRDVKAIGRRQNWSEAIMLEAARQHLVGSAIEWYRFHQDYIHTWTDFEQAFNINFTQRGSNALRFKEMYDRVQKVDEPVEDYFYSKLRMCRDLGVDFGEAKKLVLEGLRSKEAARTLMPLNHQDVMDLLSDLREDERLMQGESRRPHSIKCYNCRKEGHTAKSCRVAKSLPSESINNSRFKCHKCSSPGHFAKDCTSKISAPVICYKCQQPGHVSRNCPTLRVAKETTPVINNVETVNVVDATSPNLKFFKDAFVNGQVVKSYVDLGSQICALRDDMVPKLNLTCDWREKRVITGFGGASVTSLGSASVELSVDGVSNTVKLLIVPREAQKIELIVGHPFTEREGVQITKTTDELQISEIDPSATPRCEPKVPLWAINASVVPNNFLGHIVVKSSLTNAELCVDGTIREKGSVVPTCIVKTSENGEAVVPVLNISGADLNIAEGQKFARAAECVEGEYKREVNEQPVVMEEIITDVEGADAERVLAVINEYKDLVARNLRQIGCTSLAEMKIELTDDKPVYYRPYRLSYSERGKVNDIVKELEEAGIVEECPNSPFASPVVLVKKKNGDVRLCVDYRAINKKTVKQHYPLPLIDDQLDRLHGQEFYTSLDLSSGYMQVPLASDSIMKTAFITPDGVYCFKRMSFGLCNAPSHFQRLLNVVLGNLRYDTAMAYLDDVIIPSKTIDEGLGRLTEVLNRFRDADLTLNLSKCRFLMRKLEYLGFTISNNGIEPGERKLRAVKEFPVPVDVSKVRSFLGLASYFRRFIKGFSVIAKPLSDLLRKGTKFVWGKEQQVAFIRLKEALMNKPILAVYDPSAETELHTDASRAGIGATILQKQADGLLHPVSFYSRKTSPEESRYHSFELECLAIVCALDRFRVYLLGIPFVIRTDCNSLKLLANKRDLNPRIGRWFVKLSEFNYQIEYHRGTENKVADALSRSPVDQSGKFDVTGLPDVMGITINTDWVAAMQRACNETKGLVAKLEEGDQATHERFTLYHGRVYRIKGDKWRLYVPVDMRYDVVSNAHKALMHLGIDKTLAKLKEYYYFPKMRAFVSTYINRCVNCLYYKGPTGKQPGYLHPLEKGRYPFEIVHIDHLGPFVLSEAGNKFIAVMVDGYSKYTILRAVTDVGAEGSVTFLKDVIGNYGKPERVITDRGTAFTSGSFSKFCDSVGIQHVKISSATPRANGQVEIVNKVIVTCLATGTDGIDCVNWDAKLAEAQWAINSSVHKVTKCTPFSLVFKYSNEGFANDSLAKEVRERNEALGLGKVDEEAVDARLKANMDNMARQFDKHRRPAREYQSGDLVLVRAEAPATGQSRKLLPKYRGPYCVVKSIGNDRYLIEDIEGEQQSGRLFKGIICVDRLKLVRSAS